MYKVSISKSAQRRFRKMPRNIQQPAIRKIGNLAADPFAANNNVAALTASGGYRLRVGNWRVLYELDPKARTLKIAAIIPRGESYR